MTDKQAEFRKMQRDRLIRYLSLRDELGEAGAREKLLEGYPERQRNNMEPWITNASLADGFRRVRPLFAAMGLREEVVDLSTQDSDVALEISVTCMCATALAEVGVDESLPLLCELDFEATRRAFPEITVSASHRVVEGANVCVFRYSRPK